MTVMRVRNLLFPSTIMARSPSASEQSKFVRPASAAVVTERRLVLRSSSTRR